MVTDKILWVIYGWYLQLVKVITEKIKINNLINNKLINDDSSTCIGYIEHVWEWSNVEEAWNEANNYTNGHDESLNSVDGNNSLETTNNSVEGGDGTDGND